MSIQDKVISIQCILTSFLLNVNSFYVYKFLFKTGVILSKMVIIWGKGKTTADGQIKVIISRYRDFQHKTCWIFQPNSNDFQEILHQKCIQNVVLYVIVSKNIKWWLKCEITYKGKYSSNLYNNNNEMNPTTVR